VADALLTRWLVTGACHWHRESELTMALPITDTKKSCEFTIFGPLLKDGTRPSDRWRRTEEILGDDYLVAANMPAAVSVDSVRADSSRRGRRLA
jgi:hypothetical protein